MYRHMIGLPVRQVSACCRRRAGQVHRPQPDSSRLVVGIGGVDHDEVGTNNLGATPYGLELGVPPDGGLLREDILHYILRCLRAHEYLATIHLRYGEGHVLDTGCKRAWVERCQEWCPFATVRLYD